MTSRCGIALFAALATIAVVGLLVGGMVATSTLAQRSSMLTHVDAELSAEADYALATALDPALADAPLGVVQTTVVAGGRVTTTVAATRLARDVVWLVAESRAVGATTARRRVNLVARWTVPRVPAAPIVSRGHVRLGSPVVFVADTVGDAECRALPIGPQVLLAPGASITSVDSAVVRTDSSAADPATFFLVPPFDTLAGITHVAGDTTIAGGRIDGILMVQGRVILIGSVTVSGLVIANGAIDARSATLALEGALLSYEAPRAGHFAVEIGEAVIRHSPCAISRAWRRILPLRPANARSWAEIF